jgi:hypothetical protein
MPATWAARVIEVVEKWVILQGDPGASDGWRCLGRAVPGREPGLLLLDTREHPVDADGIAEICLAGEAGPEAGHSHLVDERWVTNAVVVLREPPRLPRHSRSVWVRGPSRRRSLEALRRGLQATGEHPIAGALAAGALDGRPDPAVEAPPGLVETQADAYRACRTPGLRLVWGAPGTGRTHVIATVLPDLVAAGQRVLLVSTADAAVDAALQAAVPGLPDAPGTAVRVGPPQLAEIAGNADVQLDLLAARASAEVDRRRARVARQLDELAAVDADVDDLVTRLAGYDDAAYRAAAARLAADHEAHGLEEELQAAEAEVERLRVELADTLAEAQRIEAELAGMAAARAELAAAAALAGAAAQAEREVRRRAVGFATVDAVPEDAGGLLARRRRRKEMARVTAALREAEAHRDDIRGRIEAHRAAAAPVTPDDVAAADERWAKVREPASAAFEAIARAEAAREAVRTRIKALRTVGAPGQADRDLVERCEHNRLPECHERLRHLLGLQSGAAGLRSRLEAEHVELSGRSYALRGDAEGRLLRDARVVATTLGRARLHPAIAGASFDVVLVDEADAAPLAEVLLALCRASTTAVLFGDLRRPGPALGPAVERSSDAAVERWVHGTAFTHTGLRSPADALGAEGCVVLTHQFRFGPGLRRLVNEVGHEVLRDARDLPGVSAAAGAEVVLVDMSTLSRLTDVRRGRRGGRWWVAGALFSCALAGLHRPGVGIVTPYRLQLDATLAALRDRRILEVAIGTAGTAGREHPTAVLDLVDGGVVDPAGDGAADRVLRHFGASLTTAAERLYVLTDVRAVRAAVAGPLLHLRAALDRGDVRVWSAAALLGLAEPPAVVVDASFSEAARLLQQLVPVADVQDDAAFVAELGRHVEAARHTLWMWSPWPAHRTEAAAPVLAAAAQRGVDVRMFLRPDEDRELGADAAGGLRALDAAGITAVIRSGHEHRGVVVIDGQTVVLATASAAGGEGMIALPGARFAERLLDELHGRGGGHPRTCPGCGAMTEARRGSGRGRDLRRLCGPCRQAPVGAGGAQG